MQTERLYNIARTADLEIKVAKTKNMRINVSREAPSLLITWPSRNLIASPKWAAL